MALINRLDQNEVVQQTAPSQNTGATETKNQTSKPIDMTADKSAEEAKKNNEILDYLNSDEFKKLSEEEQLKAFKEKYGLGLSDEELTKILTNAKKVAAEFAQRTVIESGADLQTTNAASSTDTIKAEIAAKKDIVEELKKQGIENPTQGDIYDYLVQLKESGAELTAEQVKMLKTFNALLDNGFQGLKTSQENSQAQNNTQKTLISTEVIFSEEFKNKEPEEKLNIYMDAYLKEHDPEYAKLSAEEQKKRCEEKAGQLAEALGRDENPNAASFRARSLLAEAHAKGETITNFSDASLKEKAEIAASNEIKKGINFILANPAFEKGTIRQQLIAIGDVIFAGNKEYEKSNNKVKYIKYELQNKLDELGVPISLENMSVADQKDAFTCTKLLLKDFANQPEETTLQKYITDLQDPVYANKKMATLLQQDNNISNKIKERISKGISTKTEILNELLEKGIEHPTNKDIYIHLCEKKKLTSEEKRLKKRLEAEFMINKNSVNRKLDSNEANMARIKHKNDRTTEDMVKWGVEQYKNDPAKLNEYLLTMVAECGRSVQDIENELRKYNLPQKVLAQITTNIYETAGAQAIGDDNVKDVNAIQDKLSMIDPNSATAVYGAVKLMEPANRSKVYADAMNTQEKRNCASQALNNYFEKEEAVGILGDVNDLGTVSDSDFASFTQTFIEDAGQNGTENQLYFAEELSQFGNAAITEGIAAASDSIDQNYRDAYNAIIEHSLSSGNYSDSESSRIMDALRTGNISQETLASTSIPDSAPVDENVQTSTPAQNATATASAAAASAAEQIQQAAQAAAQTISQIQVDTAAPAMPITNTVTSRISNTTGSVSGIGTSSATARASASASTSSSKKAEALNNAADTKASIDSAVKKWEEEQNQTISNEAVEALKSSVSASVIEDVLNDPDAAGDSKSALRSLVSNASSINDLFTKLVSLYGSKVETRFVESLAANGSTAAIHSFAENNGSKEVIKDLYMKCGSSTLKSELLNLLPSSTVSEMLAAGEISDLGSVNYKVLKDYILKNLSNMSNSDFNNYLKYLPFDERQMLVKARLSQTSFTGSEGGDIGDYAEKLGYKPQSTQTSPVGGTQPQGASHPKTPSGVRQEEAVYDDGIEPFYDTAAEESLEEFTNESDNIQGLTPGSDEWVSQIRNRQAGIKVPPSSVYAEYSPEDRYFNWDIGAAGPTKLPFGRDYDKQKRGTVYWG